MLTLSRPVLTYILTNLFIQRKRRRGVEKLRRNSSVSERGRKEEIFQ